MNDRLKYRIWWKSKQKYIDNRMFISPTGRKVWSGMTIPVLPPEDDDFVVGFCTGLKDKNGKLIYEGDVVYDSVYENNFVVSWDNDRTGYILSANNTNHIDYLSKILIERHNLKIIGNVHEQAE